MHLYGKEEQLNACRKCLHVNNSIRAFIQHGKLHIDNESCIPKMSEDGKNILEFKNYCRKNRVPFAIYADFESLNRDLRRVIERYRYNVPYQEKFLSS